MADYSKVVHWSKIGQVINGDTNVNFKWVSQEPANADTKANIERYHGPQGAKAQLALRYKNDADGYHLKMHCLEGWDRNVNNLVAELEFLPTPEGMLFAKGDVEGTGTNSGDVAIKSFLFVSLPSDRKFHFKGTLEWYEGATGDVYVTSWDWVD